MINWGGKWTKTLLDKLREFKNDNLLLCLAITPDDQVWKLLGK